MQQFRNKDLSELVDLLAQYTAKFSKLLADGDEEEYWDCKQKIRVLQEEIERKKNSIEEKSFKNPDIPMQATAPD